MTNTEHFDILILVGRPASGKSEIIDYLVHLDRQERRERFHLGHLDILDDFPVLWSWFEEDALLEKRLGQPRLYTDSGGYFIETHYWDLLIERLSLSYRKRRRDDPDYHQHTTTLIEFSRGAEHGGYTRALPHLSDEILTRAAILYVRVSFEESLRKNRARFNPARPDSILEHALPDEKLERLYRDDDFDQLSNTHPKWLPIRDFQLPYIIFENEDDITSGQPVALANRLEDRLNDLWQLWSAKE